MFDSFRKVNLILKLKKSFFLSVQKKKFFDEIHRYKTDTTWSVSQLSSVRGYKEQEWGKNMFHGQSGDGTL